MDNIKSITYSEIYKQPEAFSGVKNNFKTIFSVLDKVFATEYDEVIFTGCGTSLYIAQSAAQTFMSYTGIMSKGVPCSELYYYPQSYLADRKVLVVPITRKSFTTEVRMAIDKVRSFTGVTTMAITCDENSRDYNDYYILSPNANEKSVIMTGSYSSMLYMAVVMAMYVAGKKQEIETISDLPLELEQLIPKADEFAKKIIEGSPQLELFVCLGQGALYGAANEAMNKIKEMGIVNSEAYYTLEYRHGPMSLADEKALVLVFSAKDSREHDEQLLEQMKGFGCTTAIVGADVNVTDNIDYALEIDAKYNSFVQAALMAPVGQFIGYYIAAKKNINPDSPRNLSQAIVL